MNWSEGDHTRTERTTVWDWLAVLVFFAVVTATLAGWAWQAYGGIVTAIRMAMP